MKKLFTVLLCLSPALVFAHAGHDTRGLMAGLVHPTGGWDHLLAMVAVGLWAATFSGKARWLIPGTFISVMVLGFALGTNGTHLPMIEQGIAASVLILGLAAAWAKKVPAAAAMMLVGVFALFHGLAHGAEMGTHGALGYTVGFVLTTAALHAAGFGLGSASVKHIWLRRVSGSLIGLIGFGMLMGA